MDSDRNEELIRYFSNRTVWLVEPDKRRYSKVQIQPYPESFTMTGSVAEEPYASRMY
jgi:hypothetical protein